MENKLSTPWVRDLVTNDGGVDLKQLDKWSGHVTAVSCKYIPGGPDAIVKCNVWRVRIWILRIFLFVHVSLFFVFVND